MVRFLSRVEKLSDTQIAGLIATLTFAVYAMTMCRTIYTGDDGDFELAMATGGVCHPTGYPLFMLLGRLFMWALSPLIAEPAARINLMTTLFGACSVGMFYLLLRRWIPARIVPIMASLLLAFSPTLWQQCLSCEVYSLTCLFLVALLYLAARLYQGEARVLPWMTLTYGLALTNHLTMALFFPGFLVFVWCYGRSALWPLPKFLRLALLFLAPLLLYAYLPLAAKFSPSPMIWGDPQTPKRFYEHISGALYRHFMFQEPLKTPVKIGEYAIYSLLPELQWMLLFLPFGLLSLWKNQRPILFLTLYILLSNLVYSVNYDIFDIYVYYIPSYVVITFCCAIGMHKISQKAFNSLWKKLDATPEIRQRQVRLAMLVALMIPITQMSLNYEKTDKSGNFLEYDFSSNILANAPPNAVIFPNRETLFTLWYRHWVKGERPDVLIVEPILLGSVVPEPEHWYFAHVKKQWPTVPKLRSWLTLKEQAEVDKGKSTTYVERLVRTALAENRPVLRVADIRTDFAPPGKTMLDGFERVPWGVVERVYETGERPDDKTLYSINQELWEKVNQRGFSTCGTTADRNQSHILERYFTAYKNYGILAETQGDTQTALLAYDSAAQFFQDPELDKQRERLATLVNAQPIKVTQKN
jgi:hypothetical protein